MTSNAFRKLAALSFGIFAASCTSEKAIQPVPSAWETTRSAIAGALIQEARKVVIPTYDGSGQNVHPDVVAFDSRWNGFKCWMSFTPYKGANVELENPSVVASNDCESWVVPPGGINPLVDPTRQNSVVHNSDSDHAYDAAGNASVLLFRSISLGSNVISIMETKDGVKWSTPRVAFKRRSHEAVSPSMVISSDRSAKIWFVNTGDGGCTATEAFVEVVSARPAAGTSVADAEWSPPSRTNLHQPGYTIWHIDVIQLPDKSFLAAYAAYPIEYGSSCANNDLFLAWSSDGVDWRISNSPVRWRNMKELPLRSLYRASLLYTQHTNTLRIWFSAMDQQRNWWTYDSAYDFPKLLGALKSAAPGTAAALLKSGAAQGFEPAPRIAP